MNVLFLKWHLGLGDAILCNGMVRVLAPSYDRVFLPAKLHNAETVRWMFSDLPQALIVPVTGDADMCRQAHACEHVLEIGLHAPRPFKGENWSDDFYVDAGIPVACRWSEFKVPLDADAKTVSPDIFWHDDPSRNYNIALAAPKQSLYIPRRHLPFRHHIWPLQTASEIHVIDSCFLCLADQIETNAKRHVLHLYATAHDPYKKFGPPTLRKNWEILR